MTGLYRSEIERVSVTAWLQGHWRRVGLIAAAAVLILAMVTWHYSNAMRNAELERGRYLVEAVMACDSCHTPRGPNGLDMTRRFSGGTEVWDTAYFRVRGSNISGDDETGIGAWSESDLKRLLTQGIRPDGRRVASQMPSLLYSALTSDDLDAVVRFVKSAPAVRNKVELPIYKQEGYAGPAIQPRPAAAIMSADPAVQRGAYLGSLAYCMACHARRPDGRVDLANWAGKGGFRMVGSFGEVVVPNITSDPTIGLKSWSDAEIARALFEGVGRDGRHFKLPMARQIFYRRMTQKDQAALVAWVRSLPPR